MNEVKHMVKKTIKIAYADMWKGFCPEWFGITDILKKNIMSLLMIKIQIF